jgi:iron-sulfur cluster assembly accessory protein
MIKISNNAKNVLVNLIKKENAMSALLYLKGGGCNGFSYKFKMLKQKDKINKLDEKISLETPIDLYLCNKSLMYIIGTEVDYIEDIMGSRFDFKNPAIDSKCGCGTSFNFKL